jgi:hypothetical protein
MEEEYTKKEGGDKCLKGVEEQKSGSEGEGERKGR